MNMQEIRKEFKKIGLSVDFCGMSGNLRCYKLHWMINGKQNGDVYGKRDLIQYIKTIKGDKLI